MFTWCKIFKSIRTWGFQKIMNNRYTMRRRHRNFKNSHTKINSSFTSFWPPGCLFFPWPFGSTFLCPVLESPVQTGRSRTVTSQKKSPPLGFVLVGVFLSLHWNTWPTKFIKKEVCWAHGLLSPHPSSIAEGMSFRSESTYQDKQIHLKTGSRNRGECGTLTLYNNPQARATGGGVMGKN